MNFSTVGQSQQSRPGCPLPCILWKGRLLGTACLEGSGQLQSPHQSALPFYSSDCLLQAQGKRERWHLLSGETRGPLRRQRAGHTQHRAAARLHSWPSGRTESADGRRRRVAYASPRSADRRAECGARTFRARNFIRRNFLPVFCWELIAELRFGVGSNMLSLLCVPLSASTRCARLGPTDGVLLVSPQNCFMEARPRHPDEPPADKYEEFHSNSLCVLYLILTKSLKQI